jgi:probable rRNA maturation factor
MKQSTTRRGAITVPIADQQSCVTVDRWLLRRAVKRVLHMAGVENAAISVAIVDDDTISRLNWEYLRHRGPADVLSFPLDDSELNGGCQLEGEVIASAETAARCAPRFGWNPHDELLLYIVHGTLHLVGHDDRTPRQQAEMRRMESDVLQGLGIVKK